MGRQACLTFIALTYLTNLIKAEEFSFGMGSEFNYFTYVDEPSTPDTSTGTDLVDANIAPALPATNNRMGEMMEDKAKEEEMVVSPREEGNIDEIPRTEKEEMIELLKEEENIEEEMVKLLREEKDKKEIVELPNNDGACTPCKTAAPCFSSDGCAVRDVFTHEWGGFFAQCNDGAGDCDVCFPDASCAVVLVTESETQELTEETTEAPTRKAKVIQSSLDDIQMILTGMGEEMSDSAIASWKDCTAEYIKYYFHKKGNGITSLDVSLVLQKQKFEAWGRRNLRSLKDTGKIVVSYTQDNSYVTNDDVEVDIELLVKEPFATSGLRAEYMDRLRASSDSAFSSLTSVEEVNIVEVVAVDTIDIADMKEPSEEDITDMKGMIDMKELSEEEKEDRIGVEELQEKEKEDMADMEEIPEEEKEDIVDVKEAEKEEKTEEKTEEKSGSVMTTLITVFVCSLLLLAVFVCCRSREGDVPIINQDKLDMSVTSTRFDQSERSAAFDTPANTKRKYLEVYAPSGQLGITVDDSEGAPIIYAVSPMSPIRSSVFVGDRLIAVDGEDVKKLNSIEISELIYKKSKNSTRKLSIVRFVPVGQKDTSVGQGDVPTIDQNKLDTSIKSIRSNFDRSERSTAFDTPENTKRKYLEIYAPSGQLGVTVDDSEGAPIIYAVSEMSSVANKVFVGDRLIAIDGEDVKKLNSIEVSELIGKKSKNSIRKLSIVRFVPVE